MESNISTKILPLKSRLQSKLQGRYDLQFGEVADEGDTSGAESLDTGCTSVDSLSSRDSASTVRIGIPFPPLHSSDLCTAPRNGKQSQKQMHVSSNRKIELGDLPCVDSYINTPVEEFFVNNPESSQHFDRNTNYGSFSNSRNTNVVNCMNTSQQNYQVLQSSDASSDFFGTGKVNEDACHQPVQTMPTHFQVPYDCHSFSAENDSSFQSSPNPVAAIARNAHTSACMSYSVSGNSRVQFFGENASNEDELSAFDEVNENIDDDENGGIKRVMLTSSPGEEYVSSKRRRRLNQIVPNPRKPRTADYQCSKCNEPYQKNVNENPWWAVYVHDCPSCSQQQIPRIDINTSSNAIELDPNVIALYGEGIDDEDDFDDCGSDEDEECKEDEDFEAVDEEDENPFDRDGFLQQEEASKLLVLMSHARTCTGVHTSQKHAEICKSTKFLMLHIRDCNGVDVYGNECKFPWCTPCKRMLQHLSRCYEPSKCSVCNGWSLPQSFQELRTINQLRNQA